MLKICSPTYQFYDKLGARISIRRMTLDDKAHMIQLYHNMSADSLYQRFHTSVHGLDANSISREADKLIYLPNDHGRGWLAFDAQNNNEANWPVIGGMRVVYDNLPDRTTAEFSTAVRDDYHGRHIGSELLNYACDQAERLGIEKIHASVLPENTPMLQTFRKLPYAITYDQNETDDLVTIHLGDKKGWFLEGII